MRAQGLQHANIVLILCLGSNDVGYGPAHQVLILLLDDRFLAQLARNVPIDNTHDFHRSLLYSACVSTSRMNIRPNAYSIFTMRRYSFPLILKTVYSPTASACAYVLRTSVRLFHRAFFAMRYQVSSDAATSACRVPASFRAFRLRTCTAGLSPPSLPVTRPIKVRTLRIFCQERSQLSGALRSRG